MVILLVTLCGVGVLFVLQRYVSKVLFFVVFCDSVQHCLQWQQEQVHSCIYAGLGKSTRRRQEIWLSLPPREGALSLWRNLLRSWTKIWQKKWNSAGLIQTKSLWANFLGMVCDCFGKVCCFQDKWQVPFVHYVSAKRNVTAVCSRKLFSCLVWYFGTEMECEGHCCCQEEKRWMSDFHIDFNIFLHFSQTTNHWIKKFLVLQQCKNLCSLGKYADTFEGFLRRHKGQEEVEFHVKKVEGNA